MPPDEHKRLTARPTITSPPTHHAQGMNDSAASKTAIAAVIACTLGGLPAPAHAEPLSVTGRGVTRDVHCDGEDGGEGEEESKGEGDRSEGARVRIQGVKQAVALRLEAPIRLRVAGADIRIEWQAGAGVPEPRVQIQGVRQTVRRAP